MHGSMGGGRKPTSVGGTPRDAGRLPPIPTNLDKSARSERLTRVRAVVYSIHLGATDHGYWRRGWQMDSRVWVPRATRTAAVVTAVLGALAVTAGAPARNDAGAPPTFIAAVAGTPTTLAPEVYEGGPTDELYDQLGSSLFRYRVQQPTRLLSGPYAVEGLLAQTWRRAQDGSVTVTLRNGVKSPYGNTLTCNDVKWSYERNVAINGIARFLMSVGSIDQKNPITVINQRNCRVNTIAFSPVIFAALQHYFLSVLDSTEAKKHATAGDPWAKIWLSTHTASFSAYQVSSFIPGQRVEFVSNPGSWIKPKFRRLRVTQVTDPSTRLQLMLSGQADYASGFDWNQLRTATAAKRLRVWKGVGPPVDAILPNFAVAEFKDVRVRQAISLGIDRAGIIRSAYRGFGKPGSPQITSAIPTPTAYKAPTAPYNPTRARQLLAQAGLANGFSFRLALSPGRPGAYIQGVAELIQAQLARIGIRVELVVVPTAAQFQADRVAKKHDAVLVDVASAVADAPFTASLYYTSTGAQSQQNYVNPKVDQFARLALTTPPGKRRDRYTISMMKALDSNPPVIPIVEPTNTRVWNSRISGQVSGSMVRGTGFVADQLAPR